MAWLDTISGHFLVGSPKVGVIRVYNAALSAPKEMIKVSRHGILSINPCGNQQFLLQLTSGEVIVYNFKAKKEVYKTKVGHTHQI